MKEFTNKVYRTNNQIETSYISFEIRNLLDINVIEIDGSKARGFDDYLKILKEEYSTRIDSVKKEDISSYKKYLFNNEEYESDGYLFIVNNAENFLDFEEKKLRDRVLKLFDELCECWDSNNSSKNYKCVNVIIEDITLDLFEYHRAREIYIDNEGSHLSIYKNGLIDEYYGYGIVSKLEQKWLIEHIDKLLKQLEREEVADIDKTYLVISRIKNNQAKYICAFLDALLQLIQKNKCYFAKYQFIRYYIKMLKAHRSFIISSSTRVLYCNRIITTLEDMYQKEIYIDYDNKKGSDTELEEFLKIYNEEKESGSLIGDIKRLSKV